MIFNETITFSLRDTLRPKFPSLYPPPPTLQIYPVYIKSRNFFDPNVTDSIIERKLLSIILLINFINRFSSILSAVDKSTLTTLRVRATNANFEMPFVRTCISFKGDEFKGRVKRVVGTRFSILRIYRNRICSNRIYLIDILIYFFSFFFIAFHNCGETFET